VFACACSVVEAGIRSALVDVDIAIPAGPSSITDALIVGNQIDAGRRVDARISWYAALIYIILAAITFESTTAFTDGRAVAACIAGPSVQARSGRSTTAARIDVDVRSRKVHRNGTVWAALHRNNSFSIVQMKSLEINLTKSR